MSNFQKNLLYKNAIKKSGGSFFKIVCHMNGDFFEKMWGFLKNSGGDQKWGYLEAEWGFSPKNIWQHWQIVNL